MKRPCPSCPDGNEWGVNGPTGRACKTCEGKAYVGEDGFCDCDLEPTEDELAANACAACGKELT